MHVYNGRVYMFATHDRSPGNDNYRMDDWKVFSTDDLLNKYLPAVGHVPTYVDLIPPEDE